MGDVIGQTPPLASNDGRSSSIAFAVRLSLMLLLRRPTNVRIDAFLKEQSDQDFSYAAVGATAGEPPADYTVDHTRGQLATGVADFNRAKAGLQSWQEFQLGWVEPCRPETPIEAGAVVGVLARTCGLWSLNACRIVYVIDESGPVTRYGFAYGTLDEHAESGEERFSIEWHASDNSVWYDILAFSRPQKWYSRLAYPWLRRLQKRFAQDSLAAIRRSVAAHAPAMAASRVG